MDAVCLKCPASLLCFGLELYVTVRTCRRCRRRGVVLLPVRHIGNFTLSTLTGCRTNLCDIPSLTNMLCPKSVDATKSLTCRRCQGEIGFVYIGGED